MSSGFGFSSTADEVADGFDLTGKHVVITGATSGIGLETARVLYNRCATVIIAARGQEKREQAKKIITDQATSNCGQLHTLELELGSLASVSEFCNEFKSKFNKLHILINNAGVMHTPYGLTKDGFETQIGINHLGHFALTLQLLDLMKKTSIEDNCEGRVVCLSSGLHRKGAIHLNDLNNEKRWYSSRGSYSQSKLANILFAKELSRRLHTDGVNVKAYSLHPGVIQTNLGRHHNGLAMRIFYTVMGGSIKTIPQGAATSVYCAVSPDLQEQQGGLYFEDCKVSVPSKEAEDEQTAKRLFELSEKLTKITYPVA